MNVREAMMDSVGEKIDLRQVGTRYDHYMELKEVFMLGIEVIDGMSPQYVSDGDRRTKAKLEIAVECIDRRLKHLADFDNKIFSVGREVRAAGIHRTPQLTGGTTDEKPQSITQPDSTKVANSTPSESGPIKGGWPET
jgi:hypothetical protein